MNHKSQIIIQETHTDEVYGRIFEGWMTGDALNTYGELASTHCAMTSSQAIDYCVKVEKRAFDNTQAKWFTQDLQPTQNTFSVERVYEFISQQGDNQ